MRNTRQIEWLLAVIAAYAAKLAGDPGVSIFLLLFAAAVSACDLHLCWLQHRIDKLKEQSEATRNQAISNN